VSGQGEPADGEEEQVPARDDPERTPPEAHNREERQGSKKDPAENNDGRGEGEPFPEEPREAEQEDGQVDLKKAAGARSHGRIIFLFLEF
jgi:hypothetical protein